MTRYLLSDAVVGTAAELPKASDPLAGASSVPTALYIESDTGVIKLSTGNGWVTVGQMTVGTLPAGVTADGLNPGGLVVAGRITAGTGGHFSQFTGALVLLSQQADYSFGQAPLSTQQNGTLDADDGSMQPTAVVRYIDRAGHVVGNPTFQVLASDSSGGAHPIPANEPVFQSSSDRAGNKNVTAFADGSLVSDGGIGVFNTPPPATQPAVTITTSTITDTAAAAAITHLIAIVREYGLALITEN